MASGLQVASLFGSIDLQDNASSALQSVNGLFDQAEDKLQSLGQGLTDTGAVLTKLAAPFVAGFGVAINSALDFQKTMTDIQVVTGMTDDQAASLKTQLLNFGSQTAAGPQAVAQAYLAISQRVTDVATRVPIMNAALAASVAQGSDLGTTTSTLINIMNAYGLSADQAQGAADVLTRSWQMGGLSADDMSNGMARIAGIANMAGIPLGDLGAQASYLATKGFDASTSASQMGTAIEHILHPSQDLADAMAKAGISSGAAGLQMYGLSGVLEKVLAAEGGNTTAMAAMFGGLRAGNAVVALSQAGFEDYYKTFVTGMQGVTASADDLQKQDPSYQFDLLKSSMQGLGDEVGNDLLPSMQKLLGDATPVVQKFGDWAKANPDTVVSIAKVVFIVAGLGVVLFVAGQVITSVATIVGVLGGAIGLLMTPMGLVAIGAAALALAYKTNFLGIGTTIDQLGVILDALKDHSDVVNKAITDEINSTLDKSSTNLSTWLDTASTNLSKFLDDTANDLSAYNSSNYQSGGGGGVRGFRASGGPVSAGGTYLVGENGPELVTFGQSGNVIPNNKLGGMGGGDTHYHIQIMVPETALVSSAAAKARGGEFGKAFMQKMRAAG